MTKQEREAKMVRMYDRITGIDSAGMPGESWYRDSRHAVKEIYGTDWKLFCKCLAATSANCSLKANVTLARKAVEQILSTGTIPRAGYTHTHYAGLVQVSKGRLPNGRKSQAFARCLLGNEQHVVVDIWMLRYAGIIRNAPTAREYDLIADTVMQEAKRYDRTPAGHQAVLWGMARGSVESFSTYLLQYRLGI